MLHLVNRSKFKDFRNPTMRISQTLSLKTKNKFFHLKLETFYLGSVYVFDSNTNRITRIICALWINRNNCNYSNDSPEL